jgi:hypothetical protein
MNHQQLKTIAILTMLIDHVGAVLFPQVLFLRVIGRIAFPIFAFLLVEGFYHTKSVRRYGQRLALFAMISEIPFDIAFYDEAFYFGHQNIFFTLVIGLWVIDGMHKAKGKSSMIQIGYIFAGCLLAGLLSTDYSFFGILIIAVFYYFRDQPIFKGLGVFGVNLSLALASPLQILAVVGLVPIYLYNAKKGTKAIFIKWAFYAFYPLHLSVLALIRYWG